MYPNLDICHRKRMMYGAGRGPYADEHTSIRTTALDGAKDASRIEEHARFTYRRLHEGAAAPHPSQR